MRGIIIILICLILLGCATEEAIIEQPEIKVPTQEDSKMKLTSNAFEQGAMIPRKYSCQGEDINPQLKWEGVPEGAKSLALIVDDPDAPMGTWVHWLVKDISAGVTEIKENSIPGSEVENDFGKPGYGGPCPPPGVHRYMFKLYALDVETFDAVDKDEFYSKVDEHKIEEAVLMGKYTKG